MTPFTPIDWHALLDAYEQRLWADAGPWSRGTPRLPLGGTGRDDRRRAGRLPPDDDPGQQRAIRLAEDAAEGECDGPV